MKLAISKYFLSTVAALFFVALSSCDVHELPQTDFELVDYVIDLQYDTDFPLYKEVIYSRSEAAKGDIEDSRASLYGYDVRYIIEVFNAEQTHAVGEKPIKKFVFTKSASAESIDNQVKISLPEGVWDLYVWTDFVDQGSQEDKYYKTSDFGLVTFTSRDDYSGSTASRPAFRGQKTVEAVHPYRFYEGETLPNYHLVIDNVPPMARYEFVSTDVDEFIERLPFISSKFPEGRAFDTSRGLSRADLEEFKVVFRYTAFMPSTFNIFSNKPTDTWTNVTYDSYMDICDDGIVLGFDHVFVNGNEAMVNVAADIYNGRNERIASIPSIAVPIVRKKNTVVRGEFLSSYGSGGVGINPGFNGDYNIEIQ